MGEKEQPKIEVKVSASITIPFWTAGWLYTMGVVGLAETVEWLASLPWYEKVCVTIGTYVAWPLLLGVIHRMGNLPMG